MRFGSEIGMYIQEVFSKFQNWIKLFKIYKEFFFVTQVFFRLISSSLFSLQCLNKSAFQLFSGEFSSTLSITILTVIPAILRYLFIGINLFVSLLSMNISLKVYFSPWHYRIEIHLKFYYYICIFSFQVSHLYNFVDKIS